MPEQVKIDRPRYGGGFEGSNGELLDYVLAGETVEVAGGGLVQVVSASPDRVAPRCVHFGLCGGCQYQHADYAAQVAVKVEVLTEILAGAGLRELPTTGVITAEPWGYRNRIRIRLEGMQAGYSRRGTNEFLPIRMCPIAAPLLWNVVETMLRLAGQDAAFSRWLAAVSEVELFCSADESRLQVRFFLTDAEVARAEPRLLAAICERLKGEVPQLVGAGAELDPELHRRVRRRWSGAEWGAAGLSYDAAGRSYWVGRGAFFQVNRLLVDRLVELVCGAASGGLAWDLFAGGGLFSLELAEHFERVVAVEVGDEAARDLLAASRGGKGRRGFDAVQASTLEFLKQREFQRERPDLIVLDPPRAGVGMDAAGLLARAPAARMVYVSCDPVTLARDLVVLTREAYRVDSLQMIDLFPQTFHLETVVHLSRR